MGVRSRIGRGARAGQLARAHRARGWNPGAAWKLLAFEAEHVERAHSRTLRQIDPLGEHRQVGQPGA